MSFDSIVPVVVTVFLAVLLLLASQLETVVQKSVTSTQATINTSANTSVSNNEDNLDKSNSNTNDTNKIIESLTTEKLLQWDSSFRPISSSDSITSSDSKYNDSVFNSNPSGNSLSNSNSISSSIGSKFGFQTKSDNLTLPTSESDLKLELPKHTVLTQSISTESPPVKSGTSSPNIFGGSDSFVVERKGTGRKFKIN